MKFFKLQTLAMLGAFLFGGTSYAQVTGSLDLDTKSGDQALRSFEGELKSGSAVNVEVHAANVSNAIGFEFKLTFNNKTFSYTTNSRSLTGVKSSEANLLTKNGGTIFGGNAGGLESISTNGDKTTVTFSVVLNAAGQDASAVTGNGLLANIPLVVASGVAAGATTEVTLDEVTIVPKTGSIVTVKPAISAKLKNNTAPAAVTGLKPADGATLTVQGAPTDNITVSWDAAKDAEGDALKYKWQLSTDPTFAAVALNLETGATTSVVLTVKQVNDLLRDVLKVKGGGQVALYHRVIVSDGINPEVVGAGAKVTAVRGPVTAGEAEVELPSEFQVKGNYPNPFNPSTNVSFDLPTAATVGVQVFDLQGRVVMDVPAQQFAAGKNQTIQINAASLKSGMYFYRVNASLTTGNVTKMGTMTLLK